MDSMENIFKRMDLRQITSFILNGEENFESDGRTYAERLKSGTAAIYERLEKLCKDEVELDEAIPELSEALTAYQEVYAEIGMKSGAKIIYQLLHTVDCAEFGHAK